MNKITEIEAKDIVSEVLEDFRTRQASRRVYEQQWLLNLNFLAGNQYSVVLPSGEIGESAKIFSHESREVFNHIAPIVEARLSKLNKVRPSLAVRPLSNSTEDIESAKLTKKIIDSIANDLNLSDIIKNATNWSEVCGTAFYKFLKGEKRPIEIVPLSPFEIFPKSVEIESLDEQPSIIEARAMDKAEAEKIYGLDNLVGVELSKMGLDSYISSSLYSGDSLSFRKVENSSQNQVLVIERYVKPTKDNENGRLTIVVGDQLVFDGDMPFPDYPFVKQVSNTSLGSFWGTSIIERCIPVQRAYNAVKNRKIEYLGRLSSGILSVEEGSVDLDELSEDGLAPGKILVYKSGTNQPRFMESFSIPPELNREEDRLINELVTLTGVSELMRNSMLPTNVTSGTAISLLNEADDSRLSVSAESIRNAVVCLARKVMNAIKRFDLIKNLARVVDDAGKVELFYWNSADLGTNDIVLDSVNELTDSIAKRRTMAIELFKAGLFSDNDGKLDSRAKSKILEMLGLGNFESGQDLTDIHIERAKEENLTGGIINVLEVDEHDLHITEHTKFLIENKNLTRKECEKLLNHIREHKAFKKVGERT